MEIVQSFSPFSSSTQVEIVPVEASPRLMFSPVNVPSVSAPVMVSEVSSSDATTPSRRQSPRNSMKSARATSAPSTKRTFVFAMYSPAGI
ncbi:MAG: hypothetical protein VYD87_12880 [Pseudomonadota bacterium]|nr:hypothetical protein [Pseudomonadota bacterium]